MFGLLQTNLWLTVMVMFSRLLTGAKCEFLVK